MKKLILIQNDFSGSGKSTVVRLFRRYLHQHRVAHQLVVFDEASSCVEPDALYLNPGQGGSKALLAALADSPLTLVEFASDTAEVWMKDYEQLGLGSKLADMDVEVMVVLPVTNDAESFDAVTEAAEIYSDRVQYLIAHSTTSAYEEDDRTWDTSYAARVMDMFEAVELCFPAAGNDMEGAFRQHHTDLASALLEPEAYGLYGKEFDRWLKRSMGQVETARQYLFGDTFRSLADNTKEPVKRARVRKAAA